MNPVKSKVPAFGSIALTYCAVALAVVWYVLKGSDDAIYLFWAVVLFIHASSQRVIRELRHRENS